MSGFGGIIKGGRQGGKGGLGSYVVKYYTGYYSQGHLGKANLEAYIIAKLSRDEMS